MTNKKMIYKVEYLVKENGKTIAWNCKRFENEEEAENFSNEVNGRITAYSVKV